MRRDKKRIREAITSNLASGNYRYETFEERPHLVVPIVLLTEGVHSGSAGPVFYSSEVLSTLASSWNGVPVPVYHPERSDGSPCTCNDPRIIEQQVVGRMFNVRWEAPRLVGEAWIDVNKAESVHPGLVNDLKDPSTKMEVSTGLSAQHEYTEGVWNGETYSIAAQNIGPDHLALLPGSMGACSWADGCGVRNMDKTTEKYLNNVTGQIQAHQTIYRYVDSLDNDMAINYLEEVYDDYFIYRKVSRNSHGQDPERYYKVSYSISENGELSVQQDDAVSVKKTVSYESVSNNTLNEGEDSMAKRKNEKGASVENKCPECAELVDGLIANEHTNWQEQDRVFLEEMDADSLKKMVPVIKNEKAEEKETPVVENKAEETPAVENKEEKPKTAQEYIQDAPPEVQEVLNEAMGTHKAKKKELIQKIIGNSRNKFTQEQLEAKPLDELTMISVLATDVIYSGQGGGESVQNTGDNEEEPLELPIMNYDKK